jgi:UDP-N-acetylglucosamine 4,6-dehydratase
MCQKFDKDYYSGPRYFIEDVRGCERLFRAFADVEIVIHLVGAKDLFSAEYNYFETVKINIYRAVKAIDFATDYKVKK